MNSGTDGDPDSTPLSADAFRAIFNSLDDPLVVHDETGTIVEANQAAADMYGYSREEIREMDVVAPSSGGSRYSRENALAKIRQAVGGEAPTFEWQGEDADGNRFWVEVSLSRAVVDGEVFVLGLLRNIDDRKEAERRFETLIDNLPGLVYRCRNEPGWPMEFVGGRCEELTGYSSGALESGDVRWGDDVIHPADRDSVDGAVQEAVATNEPFELTYRIRTAGGDQRWVWERGRHIDTPDSRTELLEGFISDITEKKERESRLHQYERAIESASELIAAADANYNYLFANEAYRDFHDLDVDSVAGTYLPDVIGHENFEAIEPYVEQALSGQTVEYRTTRTRPSRSDRTFDIQYSPLRNDADGVTGVVATMRDISKQIERENQLKSLDRLLRHNLRNKLSVVRGQAEMIRRRTSDDVAEMAALIQDVSDRILEQADKERAIVELLIEPSTLTRLSLSDVVDGVVAQFEEEYPGAQIRVDAPSEIELTTVPEIEVAIQELIENALTHSDRSTPEITISLRDRNGVVELDVTDDGPGIPPSERRVIAEETDIEPLLHSSGMGLWLVKRIVTRVEGDIRFEDSTPRGCKITVTLPRIDQAVGETVL
jgi:PAS domain S-box-containing protein